MNRHSAGVVQSVALDHTHNGRWRRGLTTQTILLAALAATAALTTSDCPAALVSSSANFNNPRTNTFYVVSNPSKPNNGFNSGIGGTAYPNVGKLIAGVTSASITVDTDADVGGVDSLAFSPWSVTPSTVGTTFATSVTLVVADFPNPPAVQTIQGQWTESITIDGVTGETPTFSPSAAPATIFPPTGYYPLYSFYQPNVVSASSFTLTGTYKVIGPHTTTSVPINLEFHQIPQSSYANVGIHGSSTFGDGFKFRLAGVGAYYHLANPVIFDNDVDGIRFRVELGSNSNQVLFAQDNTVPEPAASALALSAMACCMLRRRRAC